MKRLMILALGSAILAAPLYAALKTGAQAPDFTTQATLAGKPFKFSLADARHQCTRINGLVWMTHLNYLVTKLRV